MPGRTKILFFVFFMLFYSGCSDEEETTRWGPAPGARKENGKPESLPGIKLPPGAEWSCYRGSPSLAGISDSVIPANPKRLLRKQLSSFAHGQIAIANNRIFAGCDNGKLLAVDLELGKLAWEFDSGHPVHGTPLVIGEKVYIGNEFGTISAISLENGNELWKYDTESMIAGSLNRYEDSRGKLHVLVGSHDFFLYCIDAESGNPAWKFKTGNYINGTAAVSGKMIVFGSCDGFLYICDLNGQKLGAANLEDFIPDSPAIAGKSAYVATSGGKVFRIELPGGEITWTYRAGEEGHEEFTTSPAVGKDLVIVAGGSGNIYCIDRETGQAAGNRFFKADSRIDSSPVLCGDKAVFGCTDGRIYIVEVPGGKKVWSYRTGGEITASVAVAGGIIAAITFDGQLFLFGRK